MGEIAEMMLDGTMCEGCGEFLHGGNDGPGFPGRCCSCRNMIETDVHRQRSAIRPSKRPDSAQCSICKKRCKSEAGLQAHMADKHGAP